MMKSPIDVRSERDGQCPNCNAKRIFATKFRLEPSFSGFEFVQCHECDLVHTRPITGDGPVYPTIHPHDIRLITAFLDRLDELGIYEIMLRTHMKRELLFLARDLDGPLHEATRRDVEEPLNRPRRELDLFLLYVNGQSELLQNRIQSKIDIRQRKDEQRDR